MSVKRDSVREIVRIHTNAGKIDIDWSATIEDGLVEDDTDTNWDLIRLVSRLATEAGSMLDTRGNPVVLTGQGIVAYEVILR